MINEEKKRDGMPAIIEGIKAISMEIRLIKGLECERETCWSKTRHFFDKRVQKKGFIINGKSLIWIYREEDKETLK